MTVRNKKTQLPQDVYTFEIEYKEQDKLFVSETYLSNFVYSPIVETPENQVVYFWLYYITHPKARKNVTKMSQVMAPTSPAPGLCNSD